MQKLTDIIKPLALIISFAVSLAYEVALDKHDAAFYWLALSAYLAWLDKE